MCLPRVAPHAHDRAARVDLAESTAAAISPPLVHLRPRARPPPIGGRASSPSEAQTSGRMPSPALCRPARWHGRRPRRCQRPQIPQASAPCGTSPAGRSPPRCAGAAARRPRARPRDPVRASTARRAVLDQLAVELLAPEPRSRVYDRRPPAGKARRQFARWASVRGARERHPRVGHEPPQPAGSSAGVVVTHLARAVPQGRSPNCSWSQSRRRGATCRARPPTPPRIAGHAGIPDAIRGEGDRQPRRSEGAITSRPAVAASKIGRSRLEWIASNPEGPSINHVAHVGEGLADQRDLADLATRQPGRAHHHAAHPLGAGAGLARPAPAEHQPDRPVPIRPAPRRAAADRPAPPSPRRARAASPRDSAAGGRYSPATAPPSGSRSCTVLNLARNEISQRMCRSGVQARRTLVILVSLAAAGAQVQALLQRDDLLEAARQVGDGARADPGIVPLIRAGERREPLDDERAQPRRDGRDVGRARRRRRPLRWVSCESRWMSGTGVHRPRTDRRGAKAAEAVRGRPRRKRAPRHANEWSAACNQGFQPGAAIS